MSSIVWCGETVEILQLTSNSIDSVCCYLTRIEPLNEFRKTSDYLVTSALWQSQTSIKQQVWRFDSIFDVEGSFSKFNIKIAKSDLFF